MEGQGYEVVYEHPVQGNGAIDILATSPSVVGICQKVMDSGEKTAPPVELLTWLDIS